MANKSGSGSKGSSGSKPTRRIIDARNDEHGNISQVLVEGNQNYIPASRAITMAERGELQNTHVVHRQDGEEHLRTNPDRSTRNNLDEMAADS